MDDWDKIHNEYVKRVMADLKKPNKVYEVWIGTPNPKKPVIKKTFKSLDSARKFAIEDCIADIPNSRPNEIGRRMIYHNINVTSKDKRGVFSYVLGSITVSCESYRGDFVNWRYVWIDEWKKSRGNPFVSRLTKSGKLSKRQ